MNDCDSLAQDTWTEPERWAWSQICAGEVADFDEKLEEQLIPEEPEDWGEKRMLSSRFLQTILCQEAYKNATPREGVRISGAWFQDTLNLDNNFINCDLVFERSRFDKPFWLNRLKTTGNISLKKCQTPEFVVRGAEIDGSLSFEDSSAVSEIRLLNVRISDDLTIGNTRCQRYWVLGAQISGQLIIYYCNIDSVHLENTQIRESFRVWETGCRELIMYRDVVGGDARISDHTKIEALDFRRSEIGGSLLLKQVTGGMYAMHALDIAHDVTIGDLNAKVLLETLALPSARIGGTVSIKGIQRLDLMDLTGAHVSGAIRIQEQISGDSHLSLANATVHILDFPADLRAWPSLLDLEGLEYSRLGAYPSDKWQADSMASRSSSWFVKLLAKGPAYAPQPYHQLALVLKNMGYGDKANDILYAGKERERCLANRNKQWAKFSGLSLLKWTIGYGYGHRYFRSLVWVAGVTLLGALVAASIAKLSANLSEMLLLSFDLLLPIVELDARHYEFVFEGWQRYYFYAHKLMGYVLVSFVIAGLSGITKK